MALERPDVRARLDPELHAALVALCDIDGVTIAEFIESLLAPVIQDRVRKIIDAYPRVAHLGISATACDSVEKARK